MLHTYYIDCIICFEEHAIGVVFERVTRLLLVKLLLYRRSYTLCQFCVESVLGISTKVKQNHTKSRLECIFNLMVRLRSPLAKY